ncbi:MAG: Wadjet anti-phage system protein JetD domain-containing protein, partial [Pseudonocardiaceae bacterium]
SDRYHQLLVDAGLAPVETAEQFADRQHEVTAAAATINERVADPQNQLLEVGVELAKLTDEGKELNDELLSLRSRVSNIPKRSLDLRDRLRGELGLAGSALPFVGELIQVRPVRGLARQGARPAGRPQLRRLHGGLPARFSELSVRAAELAAVAPPGSTVYVVENEITYLAFPSIDDAMVVYGGGYALTTLHQLAWLDGRNIVYWG